MGRMRMRGRGRGGGRKDEKRGEKRRETEERRQLRGRRDGCQVGAEREEWKSEIWDGRCGDGGKSEMGERGGAGAVGDGGETESCESDSDYVVRDSGRATADVLARGGQATSVAQDM